MAACSSLASVGKLTFFGCTVVSTVTRLRCWLRSAPLARATRKLSARIGANVYAPASRSALGEMPWCCRTCRAMWL
jgi:hypothetical protein